MLLEDHLCNHLCRFHKHSSEAYGVGEFHGLEEALVYDHEDHHVKRDVAEGGCKLVVDVMVQMGRMPSLEEQMVAYEEMCDLNVQPSPFVLNKAEDGLAPWLVIVPHMYLVEDQLLEAMIRVVPPLQILVI